MTTQSPANSQHSSTPPWIDESRNYVAFRLRITNLQHDPSWYDPEYFPTNTKPANHSWGEAARLIAMYDGPNGFYILPRELCEMITAYLRNADVLSLRSTCLGMRHGFAYELENREHLITRDNCVEFTRRLYVDRFARMCQVEQSREDYAASATILCGFCLTSHGRDAFDAEEIAKAPLMRACRGALGRFIPCEHGDLSFVKLLRHFSTSSETDICPKDRSHVQQLLGEPIALPPRLIPRQLGGYCIRAGFALEKWFSNRATDGVIPFEEQKIMDQRVINRNTYICPHLSTSSQNAWQHGVAPPWEWQLVNDGTFAPQQKSTFYRTGHSPAHHRFGQCAECQTRFGFVSSVEVVDPRTGRCNFRLQFWIWRDLGMLQSVQDTQWLAQIKAA